MQGTFVSDMELVQRLEDDGDHAFSQIYDRYWKQMYLFALGKLGNSETAKEVVQNVFVDLWQKRVSAEIKNLASYLFSSVKYKCVDQIRLDIVRTNYAELVIYKGEEEESPADQFVVFEELRSVLDTAMMELPDKTREVFRLSRLESLPVKQVSMQLCIPERTVELHISKALKHMRVYLRDFIVILIFTQIFLQNVRN